VSTDASLSAFLDRSRAQVDDALARWLPEPPACPLIIADAMRYSVFAGGKRLRPCLTLAAADVVSRTGDETLSATNAAFGPSQDLALPAACGIELIHTYSLIHDDLPAMDNDTLRRGRPTLHVVYGDGIAILAGDGLQAEAFALIAREPRLTDAIVLSRKLHALLTVGDAARAIGLVGGQALDLQAAGLAPGRTITLDADGLRAMHARKTGALIRASAVAGAIMAGANERQIDAIGRYADDLGLAFQIVDDILDVEGSDTELGKTSGKDASAAKPTYPALFGLERSRALAAECVARAKQTLADAGLAVGWLGPIADWVVSRRN
jgi:geranylgeranyl diphosphate synthase, type II